jgi:hypothetical protein
MTVYLMARDSIVCEDCHQIHTRSSSDTVTETKPAQWRYHLESGSLFLIDLELVDCGNFFRKVVDKLA